MLRPLAVVTLQTYLLLRRDRIFWPALAGALLIALFAALASQWAVAEIYKVLFDIGLSGFQLTGSAVAMFWGVKMIGDARQDGSLELQLAAPIGRGVWLVGKYLGLCLCLLTVAGLFLAIWQLTLLALDFPVMHGPQLLVFALMVLGWLVLGAVGVFFASLTRASLAIFATAAAWVVGLVAALIDQTTTPDTPPELRLVAGTLSRYWDLQQFNLVDRATDPVLGRLADIAPRFAYGLILIALLVSAAGLICGQRDALAA